MLIIFRHMLTRVRGPVLGFGVGLFLLAWPLLSAYEVVQREQDKIMEVAQNFEGIIAGLGGDVNNLASPTSYLSMRYFSILPVILGIWAVLAGSSLVASDEENGTLDLVLAHPVSRTSLFLGRWLAYVLALVVILATAWLGLVLFKQRYPYPAGAGAMVRPFVTLLAVLLFFGNLALLLSLLLPSRRLAGATATLILVAGYFVTMLARVDNRLEPLARLSPLQYYQSGEAIAGLNGTWLAGLLAGAALWLALAWWRFQRRDIRVAGEGVWGWPFRRRRPAA
jgi:ABC-2 type transport system permease protein